MNAPVETDTDVTAYLTRLAAVRAERLAMEAAELARRIESALADFDFAGTAESVIERYQRPVWPEAQAVLDLLRAGSRDRDAYQQAAQACYYSGARRGEWQSTTYVGMALGVLAYGMVGALEGCRISNKSALMEMIRQIGPVPDCSFALHRSMIGAYGGQTSR